MLFFFINFIFRFSCFSCRSHHRDANKQLIDGNTTHRNTSRIWNIAQTHDPNTWTLNIPFTDTTVLHYLKGKEIVFLGDSITRYQYLNLVHFFHLHGSWSESSFPKIEIEKGWNSWKSFHLGTSLRLGCEEICDCYRDTSAGGVGPWKENRHYYNSKLDIIVRSYLWLPPHPIRMNQPPTKEKLQLHCSEWKQTFDTMATYSPDSTDTFPNYILFVKQIIGGGTTTPDILVINQGYWSFPALRSPYDQYFNAFFQQTQKSSKRVIWKSTTSHCAKQGSDGSFIGIRESDKFLSALNSLGIEIFDAYKITREVAVLNQNNSVCWDDKHFEPFVYRELNKALLVMITHRNSSFSS
jgi:hypothetical protein